MWAVLVTMVNSTAEKILMAISLVTENGVGNVIQRLRLLLQIWRSIRFLQVMLADLNGDGKPDAYWGRLSFIRRMDDAGNVNNPEWAHSYSWGPVWYWAVREGQGQIGWPGVPVP